MSVPVLQERLMLDLGAIVMELAASMQHGLTRGTRLAVDVQADARPIRGDAPRLARLVRELVMAAASASPAGGEITVCVRSTNAATTILDVFARRSERTSIHDLAFIRDVARQHRAAIKLVDYEAIGARTTIIFPSA